MKNNILHFSLIVFLSFIVLVTGCDLHKPSNKAENIKAVLWVGGFAHDFDAFASGMCDFLPRQVPIDIKVAKDGSFLDSNDAKDLDVIIMNHGFQSAQGVLTESQQKKLLRFIEDGTDVVAIHASYYSFPEVSQMRNIYGAEFVKHGAVDIEIEIDVTDKDHPITKKLPQTFSCHSELYESKPFTKDCHVLAVANEKGKEPQYPSVWTTTYGKARVVVILPAHWPDSYQREAFQKLISRSILWAVGRI